MSLLNQLSKGPLVLDGAMSTPLEQLGIDTNSELWTADSLVNHPQKIYQVHYDYLKAGADIIITDTYQSNVDAFIHKGLSESEALLLIRKAVELAQKARDDYEKESGRHGFIAGSIGPYGAYLADGSEYRGDYDLSSKAYQDFHRPRLKTIIETGVDVLAIETQPKLSEVKAILDLLENEFPDTKAYVSFSLKDAKTISDGTLLQEAVQSISHRKQVIAVGVNCIDIKLTTPAITTIRNATDQFIIVYPNSGAVYDPKTKTWLEPNHKESFTSLTPEWIKAGANIIGGCCTTTSNEIAEIKKAIRKEK